MALSLSYRLGYGLSMVVFGIVALIMLGSPRESDNETGGKKVKLKQY